MPAILPSQRDAMPIAAGTPTGAYTYPPQYEGAGMPQPPSFPLPPQGSPYGAPVGIPGAADRQLNGSGQLHSPSIPRETPVNRTAGVTGEALSAGPAIIEQANGERKVLSPTPPENANAEPEQQDRHGGPTDTVLGTA